MEQTLVSLLTVLVLFSAAVKSTDETAVVKYDGARSLDASDVTWAHAVNSRASLESELAGPVDFIEADVSLGLVKGREAALQQIPIMAHPPNTTSDLSLNDFIALVTKSDTRKGVKLDFKSLAVVEPSLVILQQYSEKLNFSLWLNADILYGPISSTTLPVKDDIFLSLCHQYYPDAVVSVGWTTQWYWTYSTESWHYKWSHVRKMADIIRCLGYESKYPTFTFPVRGIFASRSIPQLQWLLGVITDSSLTVWSAKGDTLHLKDLIHIRKSFPVDKVFYDVPDKIGRRFQEWKNLETVKHSSRSNNQWMTFTHGPVSECNYFTYTTNDIIVFGETMTTAVLLKKMISVDDKHGFKAKGIVRFFSGYDRPPESSEGHHLTIVIVDVSLLAKNSSTQSLDLTESDTDILWTAMNASQVHTFEQGDTDQCRVFKLDTDNERSFQAWKVPCYEMVEQDTSIDKMIAKGIEEVPSGKRLVLPKSPFMLGFMSSGNGHAVVHDFEISDDKGDDPQTNASSVVQPMMGYMSVLFLYFVNVIRRLVL